MKLNPPKKNTFYISIVIAAVGVVVYAVHLFARDVAYLQPAAFFLAIVAFVLLCLGVTREGF
jgi:hypothetical protein